MADMDQGFKRLCQTHPQDFLEFAVPGARYLGPLPTDLATEPQLTADTLFRANYQGIECAVNIEAEAVTNAAMAERCFTYGARAYIVHRLPVLTIVLWLQKDVQPPASPFELRVGDWLIATWHFRGIEIYDVPAERILSDGTVGLLPLVPFMRNGGSETAIEAAARLVRDRAPAEQVNELESLLAVFGARQLGSPAMMALLRRIGMTSDLIQSSPLYQEWVAEAAAQAAAQARQEAYTALTTLWRARFGEPSADVLAALEQRQDTQALLDLVTPLALADDVAAARTVLGLEAAPPAEPQS